MEGGDRQAGGPPEWEQTFKQPTVSVERYSIIESPEPAKSPAATLARSPLGSPDLPFSEDEYLSAEEPVREKSGEYLDAVDRSANSSPAVLSREQMVEKMTSLVDFYFGDDNFAKDRFLRTKSRETADGWISITLILSFKRVRKYTDDAAVLLEGIRESKVVVLNSDETAVKRRNALPVSDRDRLYNSAVLEHLPPAASDEGSILELCAAAAASARAKAAMADGGAASPGGPREATGGGGGGAASVPRGPVRVRLLSTQPEFDAVLVLALAEEVKSKVTVHPLFGKYNGPGGLTLPVVLAEYESPLACKLGCDALTASEGRGEGDWRSTISAVPVCKKEKRHRRRKRLEGGDGEYSEYSGDSSAALSDTDMPWTRSPALGRSPLGERGSSPKVPSPMGSPSPRRAGRSQTRKTPLSGLEPHKVEWRARSASPSWRSKDTDSPGLPRRSPGLLRRAGTDSPLTVLRHPRGPDGSTGFGRGRGRPVASAIFPS